MVAADRQPSFRKAELSFAQPNYGPRRYDSSMARVGSFAILLAGGRKHFATPTRPFGSLAPKYGGHPERAEILSLPHRPLLAIGYWLSAMREAPSKHPSCTASLFAKSRRTQRPVPASSHHVFQ